MIVDRSLKYPIPIHASNDILDTTKLNGFMSCPRSFFYGYVMGWNKESNHLVFGKAWHEALEHMLLHGYDKTADAFNLFLKEYKKVYDADEFDDYSPKTVTRAMWALLTYADHYKGDQYDFKVHTGTDGKKLTECAGSVYISDEHLLYFRMDAILEDLATGQLYPQEHKTGSSTYMWVEQWDLAMQVFTYLYVMYCMFDAERVKGIQINGVIFKKTKDNETTDAKQGIGRHFEFLRPMIYKAPHQIEGWMTRTAYWMDMMRYNFDMLAKEDPSAKVMRAFPMATTSCTKYLGCEYKDFCNTWDNPIRAFNDYGTPLGWEEKFWDPTVGEIRNNLGEIKI